MHQTYVEELDTTERYDVIVSGLPLTNFTPARVERIMARYMDLLHPGGILTYFAYLGTRRARQVRHRPLDSLGQPAPGRRLASATPPRRWLPRLTARFWRSESVNALSDVLGHLPPASAYTVLALAVLAESVLLVGAFIPTLTLLLTAGALARTGYLSLPLVIASQPAPWWPATSSPTAPAGCSAISCARAAWAVVSPDPPGTGPGH